MKLTHRAYPCLSDSVRITIHKNVSILSNIDNGKWISISRETLELFRCKNEHELSLRCLKNGISHDESLKFISTLMEFGFIGAQSDQNLIKKIALRSAYLNVTKYCNLSCPSCYYESDDKAAHGLEIKKMIVIADSLYSAGVRYLVISGGEPLTKDGIFELLRYCHGKRFKEITLLTNGTLITPKIASDLVKLVDRINISLDGPNDEINAVIRGSGNFSKTLNGIDNLKKAGCKNIKVITTITAVNINYLEKIRNICRKLDVQFGTSVFTETGKGAHNRSLTPSMADLKKYFKKNVAEISCNVAPGENNLDIDAGITCGCCTLMISVDCLGNVFPCHLLHEAELKIGNLIKSPDLIKLLSESKIAASFQIRTVEYRKCHGCSVEYFCKGGCLARTYKHKKQFKDNPWLEKDPICTLHKSILSAQIWEQ